MTSPFQVGLKRTLAIALGTIALGPAMAQPVTSGVLTALPGNSKLAPSPPEALSGGATTVFVDGPLAFNMPAHNLTTANRRTFAVGNSFFTDNWVIAPASTSSRDGLGPLFNAVSCSSCHFRDGRGTPPVRPGDPVVSMIFRLGVLAAGGKLVDEPNYGTQFQNRANPGIPPEGDVVISYTESPGSYPDGTTFSLRFPSYRFENLGYGSMSSGTLVSPRVAPQMIGMGLLEAIPEEDILANTDPDDKNGDSVSGRPNRVHDVRKKWTVLGRFGWKANQPTVEQQSATAFAHDLGITTEMFPEHIHTKVQTAANAAPNGGTPEIEPDRFAKVTLYSQTLGVPARRKLDDPKAKRGERLFEQITCTACHISTFKTGPFPTVPELENQTIHPYTDMLLHDMGERLADHRPDAEATGSEWRTPPLWGIGLIGVVNKHTNFLHDGRARNLEESILWHDGEAHVAKQRFMALPKDDRQAVLEFLDSL